MSDSSQQPQPSSRSPSQPNTRETPRPSSSDPAAPPLPSDQPVEPKTELEPAADLDASIEQHISLSPKPDDNNAQPTGSGGEAEAEAGNADEDMVAPGNPVQDASVDALTAAAAAPPKKETSLREFLGKMDDYAPIVCCAPAIYSSLVNYCQGFC